MPVAEVLTVLEILKCGYDIINYYGNVWEREILHRKAMIKDHQLEEIGAIIRQRGYIGAGEQNLYLKLAMILPLSRIKTEMDRLCEDTISMHRALLRKLHFKNPTKNYIEQSTELYNRLKDIVLFDPDFPILMGYKSIAKDVPFPTRDHDIPSTGNVQGTKDELDSEDLERCIKWSLRKTFLGEHHKNTEQGLKDICATHRHFHELLWRRYKILMEIISLEDLSKSTDDMTEAAEKNTEQLQETEVKLDTLLITNLGFVNMIKPKHLEVYTGKPKAMAKKALEGVADLSETLLWPLALVQVFISSNIPRFFKSKKYYTKDISQFLLSKKTFPAASKELSKALAKDKGKTLSLLFRCYQLLFLTKVIDERLVQLRSEIDESAEMLNIDKETLDELEERINSLSSVFEVSNSKGIYSSTINRMVHKTQAPTEQQFQDLRSFTTPLTMTIRSIFTKMESEKVEHTFDMLKHEVLALRELMEQLLILSNHRFDENVIERYLEFVDEAFAANSHQSKIEESLKDLQDRVEKLERSGEKSM